MENASRIIAACLSGLFLAMGAFLAFRQWQAGEDVTLLLPCLLGGTGLGFLAFAFFYPLSSEADSCMAPIRADDDSESGSNGLEEVDVASNGPTN